jgi:hypothetical protein
VDIVNSNTHTKALPIIRNLFSSSPGAVTTYQYRNFNLGPINVFDIILVMGISFPYGSDSKRNTLMVEPAKNANSARHTHRSATILVTLSHYHFSDPWPNLRTIDPQIINKSDSAFSVTLLRRGDLCIHTSPRLSNVTENAESETRHDSACRSVVHDHVVNINYSPNNPNNYSGHTIYLIAVTH